MFGDTCSYHRDYGTYTGIAELILIGPPFLSYLDHNLFLNSSLAYHILTLLPLGPQVVNYHFTLDSIINSGSLVLFPENSYLTFIIP